MLIYCVSFKFLSRHTISQHYLWIYLWKGFPMKIDTNRLKECREKNGISKQEAARRIGVSQPAYLRYESGDRQPSVQMLKEIAKVLNTSVDYLSGISDDSGTSLIEVNKQTHETLFQIVEQCSALDSDKQARLLSYIEKIKTES